jgi:hypothetical protein
MNVDLIASTPDLYAPSAQQVSDVFVPAMTFAVLHADGTFSKALWGPRIFAIVVSAMVVYAIISQL